MSEEENVVEEEQVEEPAKETVTEELKVQTEDLFKAINDLIREGTVRRITVMRNDRVLLDIPLVAGMAASLVFAFYMPFLSAIVAYTMSSSMSLNSSSASGLASASLFLTVSPWTMLRTANSTILPLLVLGMSATWTIFAGT